MSELAPGYSVEVDTIDEPAWCRVLEQFDDANIYQTWSYDEVRCGRDKISHLLLRENGNIAAIAQARLVTVPLIKAGIAYVRWGPLWRRHGGKPNPEIFGQAIRALRNEYADRRGLVLRLYPSVFDSEQSCVLPILKQEGFSLCSTEKSSRTLILDLSKSLDGVRTGTRPHWQRELKVAEKQKLQILEGSEDELFEMFVVMYKEMVARKQFDEPNDIHEFLEIQRKLPEKFKMRVMLCRSSDGICAGLIAHVIGGTAIYLFGATSNVGMKSRGSYLLQWKLIEWLKDNHIASYDLNGIDPAGNPGTYKFKADLCGNNGKDIHFLGRFDTCTSMLSQACVACGDALRGIHVAVKKKLTNSNRRVFPVAEDKDTGRGWARSTGTAVIGETAVACEFPQTILTPSDGACVPPAGFLIMNADDWGRDVLTTDRILDCSMKGAVSSVSAMVFMEDSERAADLAWQREIEAGLHLNFTTPFSSARCPSALLKHQQKVAYYLLRHRLAQIIFHPGLVQSFEYLVKTQLDEFNRLYGVVPERIDGHHHMHLCANVLIQRLLPSGAIVRRNFSFERSEKSIWNRSYRRVLDWCLARKYKLADYFFSLPPLGSRDRLRRISSLAQHFIVEVETHPVNPAEYQYLIGGSFHRDNLDVRIALPSAVPWGRRGNG